MRPTSVEVLRGIRRSLLETILPQIGDPFIQGQVQAMVMLVDSLAMTWDSEAEELRQDNQELAELLTRAAPVLTDFARSREHRDLLHLASRAQTVSAHDSDSLRLSELAAKHRELEAVLADLLVALEELAARNPVEPLLVIRRDLYWALARQYSRRPSMHRRDVTRPASQMAGRS